MSGIGVSFRYDFAAVQIPLPNKLWIGAKGLARGELHRIQFAPVAILPTKGGNAAVGRDSRASDHQDATVDSAADLLVGEHQDEGSRKKKRSIAPPLSRING